MPDHSAILQSPDYQALIAAVVAAPADDFPRLATADFLDEHGMAKRARLIRLQIETDKATTDGQQREIEALSQVVKWPEWQMVAHQPNTSWVVMLRSRRWTAAAAFVRRGFVDGVRMRWLQFAEDAAELFAAQPITHVLLEGKVPLAVDGHYRWYRRECFVPSDGMGATASAPMAGGATMHVLPEELWVDPLEHAACDSQEAAYDYVSRHCVSYGRSAARLPSLDGHPIVRAKEDEQ